MTSPESHVTPRLPPPDIQDVDRIVSRSPHPYHRRSSSLIKDGSTSVSGSTAHCDSSESSTERGTEADDEKGPILRGLPAPPLRARKGLRGSKTPLDITPAISPLPTPPANEAEREYFLARRKEKVKDKKLQDRLSRDVDLYKKYVKRRQAEIVRRCTEVVLLVFIGSIAGRSAMLSGQLRAWKTEIYCMFWLVGTLCAAYPARYTLSAFNDGFTIAAALKRGFHIPSRFDLGPLLYPVFVPFFISVSLVESNPAIVIVNIILGLSSLPRKLIPISGDRVFVLLHWSLTLCPLLASKYYLRRYEMGMPLGLKSNAESGLSAEILSLLFPLHQTLLVSLKYITTTSLDPAELHLLSAGLINLLLFAVSPQAHILRALMWLGSLCLFIFCQKALSWEIILARIPAWKLARNQLPRTGMLSKLEKVLGVLVPQRHQRITQIDSDDEDYEYLRSARKRSRANLKSHATKINEIASDLELLSHQQAKEQAPSKNGLIRSATVPSGGLPTLHTAKQRRRSIASSRSGFLSLTIMQAQALKWLIAGYVYVIVILIVLVPLRYYISKEALSSQEPFGWAMGYLFGNIAPFRLWTVSNNLERWIKLPAHTTLEVSYETGWFERIRQTQLGSANVRLLLSGYCLSVLIAGLGIVLRLKAMVEVDTRRKVFHGIMVAMMLPTIAVDPCFISLALILILAVFLLLDLCRASQLPPVSKPLTNFLAPYVDGRDHRGPVIVSHIFLLIGCAIPLWLSLAGSIRSGQEPWTGWETPNREVSMMSGVICVGMGDAAASLIGRRYGKTKWFWGGGKSLEGSLAFATAVTVGLMACYVWLRIGGWVVWDRGDVPLAVLKAMIAGSGASLLETVLTAANDNVVVPVGLWLLVRGLNI